MFDTLLQFFHLPITQMATNWLGIVLYWVPAGLCIVGYIYSTVVDYLADLDDRSTASHYKPDLTVGRILARILLSVIPGVNIALAVFQMLPRVVSTVCDWLGETFNTPLVPDSKAHKAARAERNGDRKGVS